MIEDFNFKTTLKFILTLNLNLGHKADWCHKNTNPWDLKKKLDFKKLNTPACEQVMIHCSPF